MATENEIQKAFEVDFAPTFEVQSAAYFADQISYHPLVAESLAGVPTNNSWPHITTRGVLTASFSG
ncbi:MAG: hypothetical protein R3C11_22205 [Planctomycetaceae bacterium]